MLGRFYELKSRYAADVQTLLLGAVIAVIFLLAGLSFVLPHLTKGSDDTVVTLVPFGKSSATLIVNGEEYHIGFTTLFQIDTDCQLESKDSFRTNYNLDCDEDGNADGSIIVYRDDGIVTAIVLTSSKIR